MKRVLLLLIGWAALVTVPAAGVWAQGRVSGLVRTPGMPAGQAVAGAVVSVNLLNQENPVGYGARTVCTATGFLIDDLPPGLYTVLASAPEAGFSTDVVEVLNGNTTVVDLVLTLSYGTDLWPPLVHLQGTAIVTRDSVGFLHSFLGVGTDSLPSYRLLLGPESYQPLDTAARRPQQGQAVEIGGRLFGYSEPPMIVVTTVNRLSWRDPADPGHGGSGGLLYASLQCDPELRRIELWGTIEPQMTGDSLSLRVVDEMDSAYYQLDLGDPSYAPPSAISRPVSSDAVRIVGGLTYCLESPYPRVLVYEIDELLWRVPGDITGLEAVVAVTPEPAAPPGAYLLADTYPNPFNAQTTIRFTLPHSGHTRLTVYDLEGRRVEQLQDGVLAAGSYTRTWDGAGRTSGIYFYSVELEHERVVGRMVLLK